MNQNDAAYSAPEVIDLTDDSRVQAVGHQGELAPSVLLPFLQPEVSRTQWFFVVHRGEVYVVVGWSGRSAIAISPRAKQSLTSGDIEWVCLPHHRNMGCTVTFYLIPEHQYTCYAKSSWTDDVLMKRIVWDLVTRKLMSPSCLEWFSASITNLDDSQEVREHEGFANENPIVQRNRRALQRNLRMNNI